MIRIDTHFREILSKGSVSLLAKILGVGTNFALQVILGRALGAEGVGLYYLSFAIVSFAALVARLGFDYNLTRVVAARSESEMASTIAPYFARVLKVALASAALTTVALVIAAPMLSISVFSKPQLQVPLQVMAVGLVPLTVSILVARALQGVRRTGEAMLIEFTITPLVSCLFVYALVRRFDVTGAALSFCIGVASSLLIALWVWRKHATKPASTTEMAASESVGRLIRSGSPYLGVLVLQQLSQVLPLFVLGAFSTSAEVGVYYAALRTAALTGLVLIAVNSILAPKLAAMYHSNDTKSFERIIRSSGFLILLLASPVLALFLSAPDMVMRIFGEEFVGHGNLLRVMAAGQLINVTTGTLGFVLMMTDKARIMFVTTLLLVVTNAVLCVALIPTHGAYGAAVASAGSLLVAGVTRVVLIWRELGILALPTLPRFGSDSGK